MTPLAVWDAGEKSWMTPLRPARIEWLREQGVPVDETYRTEFYLVDAPFARVFTYHRNDQGRRHFTEAHIPGREHNHGRCEVATEPPYDISLSELPPGELL